MARFRIRWDGTVEERLPDGAQSQVSQTNIQWNNNPYTWDDVALIFSFSGKSPSQKKRTADRWKKEEPEKYKRLVTLVCRVNGEKSHEETKEIREDIEVTAEDIEMVVKSFFGEVKLEKKDVL